MGPINNSKLSFAHMTTDKLEQLVSEVNSILASISGKKGEEAKVATALLDANIAFRLHSLLLLERQGLENERREIDKLRQEAEGELKAAQEIRIVAQEHLKQSSLERGNQNNAPRSAPPSSRKSLFSKSSSAAGRTDRLKRSAKASPMPRPPTPRKNKALKPAGVAVGKRINKKRATGKVGAPSGSSGGA